MRNVVTILFIIFIGTSGVIAEPEIKGTPDELSMYLVDVPGTVTISGMSELKVQADQAIVKIDVTTENSLLETALKANQEVRKKVIEILSKSGISSDKIFASKFSSTPQYGFFRKKPSNYEVENLITIKVANEKDFQEVAKVVDSIKEVDYKSIEFEISNKDELKSQAVEKACDAVLKKKTLYESKLDVTLTPRSFTEATVEYRGVAGDSYGDEGYLLRTKVNISSKFEETSEMGTFGEVVFYGRMSVTYFVDSK